MKRRVGVWFTFGQKALVIGGILEQFQVVIEKHNEFFSAKLSPFIVLNHKHSLVEVQVFRMPNDFLDVTTRLISVTAIAAIAIAVIIKG